MIEPRVIEHDDVFVVRDDLFPGGTKARFLPSLFDGVSEVVLRKPSRGWRPNCFSHSSGTAWQTRHDIRSPARAIASANIDGKEARRPDRRQYRRVISTWFRRAQSSTAIRLARLSAVWLRCAGSRASYCSGRTLHWNTAGRSVVRGWLRRPSARSSSGLAECPPSCCPGWPPVTFEGRFRRNDLRLSQAVRMGD